MFDYAKIVDGKLVIEIPLDNLRFAFDNSPRFEKYDEEKREFYNCLEITDEEGFFQEFIDYLNSECQEDGSTPITSFLDEQFDRCTEKGCMFVEEVER